jgi:hypothetical protein
MTHRELQALEAQEQKRLECEERQMALVSRSIELAHLEAAAGRAAKELERLRDRSLELGMEESAQWFDSAVCATRGGAKELRS